MGFGLDGSKRGGASSGKRVSLSSTKFVQGTKAGTTVATVSVPATWTWALSSDFGGRLVKSGDALVALADLNTISTGTVRITAQSTTGASQIIETFDVSVVADSSAGDPVVPDGYAILTDKDGNWLTDAAGTVLLGQLSTLAISGTAPDGEVGKFYGFAPTVTGGNGPKSFQFIGNLPGGLSFSSRYGTLSGTPTVAASIEGAAIVVTDATGSARLDLPKFSITQAGLVWSRERAVTLSNTGASDASGYQHLVTLDASNFDFSSSAADGSDLRITDSNRVTALPFWIEAYDASAKVARVWVRADVAAGATKTIYLYSGKLDAAAASRGASVFDFFDDFNGVLDWNRYLVDNPIVRAVPTTWRADIAGDPLVIRPGTVPRFGAYYFGANGSGGGIGYMEAAADSPGWNGRSWIDKSPDPILAPGGPDDMHFAIKPSVFEEGGLLHMAYAGRTNGQNWKILYATAPAGNRLGPWTKKGVLLEPDGSDAEGARLDCPCWFRDTKTGKVRLYYSGHEAVANEPRNFCLATSDSFAGPFVRSAANPLARPNPAISWMETGLGGMSVEPLADGSYRIAYNAFDRDGISRMGRTISADGIAMTLRASDLLFERVPNAWDSVKLYRPCIYDIGDGVPRLLYNALGGTENIGYAEYSLMHDVSKWTINLQGEASYSISGGRMSFRETKTQNPGAYFTLNSNYVPLSDVVIDVRARTDAVHETQYAQFATHILASGLPFPGNAYDNQFLFVDQLQQQVRHQNRNGGGWGDEDVVLGQFPALGTFYRYRLTKRAASMDWEVRSDADAQLGKITGNTDAPQNTTFPYSFGVHGMSVTLDFVLARKYLAAPPTVAVGAPVNVSRTDL